MRIAIVHNQVMDDASEAELDVLVQAAAVSESLERLGHESVCLGATLDLSALRAWLQKLRPHLVFNLVESLEGSDWLMFLATGLFDAMRLPYTGSRTESMVLANHKLLAKERLRQAGLPTPRWVADDSQRYQCGGNDSSNVAFRAGTRYVLKAVSEHASIGLDDRCVVAVANEAELRHRLNRHSEQLGAPCFAEEFIDGREFNLSLLASATGPEVLPPAEIDFSSFPCGKPRIVGYRAKWDESSFDYHSTPRCFEFASSDRALLQELEELARACWQLFGLGGYARVDFRVDAQGRVWILEINANPCLSPDAGFAAALEKAAIPFDQAIERIVHHTIDSEGDRVVCHVSHSPDSR